MSQSTAQRRFASLLALATLAGAIALPVLTIIIWLFWDYFAPTAAANLGQGFDLSTLGVGARMAGFAVSMVGAAIWSYGLLSLRRTFAEAADGRPLSLAAVRGFRRFAWVAFLMVFVGIVQNTLYIMIYSISDPNRDGQLSIHFGSGELGALFIGLLFVFVAHVFATGQRAVDENAAFL
ncbi:hypothetical protein [Parasphingopyxis sp.]|uniref:hypothetical protein n=1 Tax=Parasphingopyxis sp. TaxID=1920299 RepID=UPI0026095BAD|nr:hypothetical protein [Parasphingopyxis sp.]